MKKILVLTIAILVLTVSFLVGWKYNRQPSPSEKLNAEITTSKDRLDFMPFYFRPAVKIIGGDSGYTYKDGSYQVSGNILSFQFINASGQLINITQQSKPENFDTSAYTGREQLNVATGRAILGQNKNDTTGAIFGDKTMLFAKAGYVIDDDTLRAILAAFSKD